MKRINAGFTLIEAMAVLTILALSLTLGIPSLSAALERHRVVSAMHLLSTDLALARSTAIMKRNQVVVCPGTLESGCRDDRNWSEGWLVFHDADRDRNPDATTDLIQVRQAPDGVDAGLLLAGNRRYVRYQANGHSAFANLTIRVCSDSLEHGRIVVSNSGRVRTSRGQRGTACAPS